MWKRPFALFLVLGILLTTVAGVFFILYLSRETQSVPLKELTINTNVFPERWQMVDVYSYTRNEADEANENLMTVWEKVEINGLDDNKLTSYMFSRQYNHFLHAAYKYRVLTSEQNLPSQVFFTPETWNYASSYADRTHVVCSWPNAGSYCKIIAQYGSYIVSFQYESHSNENLGAEFQAIWEEIDKHIGLKLEE